MPASQIAPVDAKTGKPATYVIPKTVTLTSKPYSWQGIAIEQFTAPAVERSDWLMRDHSLTLHLGPPTPVWVREAGTWQEKTVRPGDASVFPAGEPRGVIHAGGFDVLLICLSPGFVNRSLHAEPFPAEIVRQTPVRDRQIERIGLLLRDELADGCPGGRLFVESLGTALTVHLLRHYAVPTENLQPPVGGLGKEHLRRCLQLIHDRLADDLTLSDLAASVHLSPYHFARLFKQSTGQSPHRYVIAQRIEKAKSLLRSGRLPVGEIACAVGFGDQAHFNRHFKKLTRLTPTQFRKEC